MLYENYDFIYDEWVVHAMGVDIIDGYLWIMWILLYNCGYCVCINSWECLLPTCWSLVSLTLSLSHRSLSVWLLLLILLVSSLLSSLYLCLHGWFSMIVWNEVIMLNPVGLQGWLAKLFFTQIFPETRPLYPVTLTGTLIENITKLFLGTCFWDGHIFKNLTGIF